MSSAPDSDSKNRVHLVVEGIKLDLPSMVPPGENETPGDETTPFNYAYNYLALQVMPHSIWLNGACYGIVRPGDDVRLGAGGTGEVFVNGRKREIEAAFPFGEHDDPPREP